jgi:hypothetical protein
MTPEVIALLSTLSSVAAAMVGFSGLLTAFRVSVETLDPNDVSNIRILLIFSVAALLFAIIPLPFHVVGNDEAMFVALTIALGIFLAVWLWQSPRWMRRHQLKPRNTRLYWGMLVLQAALGATLIVAGFSGANVAFYYLAGVLWCLITAIVVFVVQVFVMLPLRSDH